MALERVQKILARAGVSSRRKAEELIQEGLVTINGKPAKLGDKAEWGKDSVKVKGKLLFQKETLIYLAFNKPKGVISMLSDPQGRPTLAEFTKDIRARVFPVGRLDFNSEGLILLTNDGDFAEKVQKKTDIPRFYNVKVKGHPTREMLAKLEKGGWAGDHKKAVKPYSIRMTEELQSKAMVETVILGGGAFDLKTFFEAKGFLVERVIRKAIGHITLKGLTPGKFRYLKPSQAFALLEQSDLALRAPEVKKPRPHIIPKFNKSTRD